MAAPRVADPQPRRRLLGWLGLALTVAVADQISKAAALHLLVLHRPVPVVPTLDLMLTYNTGAAFSLLSDAGGWQRWLFIALAVAVSAVLVRWLAVLPAGERWSAGALALVLGGAAGNLVDRVFRDGKVVDFIYFHVGDFHWPAFNLADSAICVGAALLVLHALFVPERTSP
jgi:signal peptidase II